MQSKKKMNDDVVRNIIENHSRSTEAQYKDLDNKAILREIIITIKNESISLSERISTQLEFLGYITEINEGFNDNCFIVTDIVKKFTHPMISLYQINNGNNSEIKVKIKTFNANKFKIGDIIKLYEIADENKWKKTVDSFEMLKEKEKILKLYSIMREKE